MALSRPASRATLRLEEQGPLPRTLGRGPITARTRWLPEEKRKNHKKEVLNDPLNPLLRIQFEFGSSFLSFFFHYLYFAF